MPLVISGSSDDLIVIEGDIVEEFNYPYDELFYLATQSGLILDIVYNGFWRINVLQFGNNEEDLYSHYPAGTKKAIAHAENNYSDVVVIEGTTLWVVGGKDFARA
jgi:hypothetical protein